MSVAHRFATIRALLGLPIVCQKAMKYGRRAVATAVLGVIAASANAAEQSLSVLATAYNSTVKQTDAHPNQGAWGDRLEPGMKVIAVSPDLVKLGLKRGTKVRIDGVEGEWTVLDRTPSRYKMRIDLYMGLDVKAARKWGRKRVMIRWSAEADK
jgi:3D (Asp-Asp-Asp) domain-containing protein